MRVVELPHMPWYQVEEAFPFLFAWNSEMRIVHVGPSLARIARDVAPGAKLDQLFNLERPLGAMNADWLCRHRGILLLLRHHGTGMMMRGQVMHLEQMNLDVFLGSPNESGWP